MPKNNKLSPVDNATIAILCETYQHANGTPMWTYIGRLLDMPKGTIETKWNDQHAELMKAKEGVDAGAIQADFTNRVTNKLRSAANTLAVLATDRMQSALEDETTDGGTLRNTAITTGILLDKQADVNGVPKTFSAQYHRHKHEHQHTGKVVVQISAAGASDLIDACKAEQAEIAGAYTVTPDASPTETERTPDASGETSTP